MYVRHTTNNAPHIIYYQNYNYLNRFTKSVSKRSQAISREYFNYIYTHCIGANNESPQTHKDRPCCRCSEATGCIYSIYDFLFYLLAIVVIVITASEWSRHHTAKCHGLVERRRSCVVRQCRSRRSRGQHQFAHWINTWKHFVFCGFAQPRSIESQRCAVGQEKKRIAHKSDQNRVTSQRNCWANFSHIYFMHLNCVCWGERGLFYLIVAAVRLSSTWDTKAQPTVTYSTALHKGKSDLTNKLLFCMWPGDRRQIQMECYCVRGTMVRCPFLNQQEEVKLTRLELSSLWPVDNVVLYWLLGRIGWKRLST